MIPIGTKVIVLASSTSAPGTKIRRGSLGYISSIGATLHFHQLNVFVTTAKIVFTRFGYEKKRRDESKFVGLIFPHRMLNPKKSVNIQKYINKLVHKSLDASAQIREMFKSEGVKTKNITNIIVHKTLIECNVSSNYNEFKSWTSSILCSGHFHKLFLAGKKGSLNKMRDNLLKDLPPSFSNHLYACIKYRRSRNLATKEVFSNPIHKQLMVKQLKQYMNLCTRKEIAKLLNSTTKSFWAPSTTLQNLYFLANTGRKLEGKHFKQISVLINQTSALIDFWGNTFKHLK